MHNYDSCQNSKVPDHHRFSRLLIGQTWVIKSSYWLTEASHWLMAITVMIELIKTSIFSCIVNRKTTIKSRCKVSSTFNKAFNLAEMDERELLREGPRIFVLKEPWLAILPEVQNPATNVIITIIFRHFILKDLVQCSSLTSGHGSGHKVNLNFLLRLNKNFMRRENSISIVI